MLIRQRHAGTTPRRPTRTRDDQTATVGTALDYAFPTNTFNGGRRLHADLPRPNPTTRCPRGSLRHADAPFSHAGDRGHVSVQVTASDGNGGSVSDLRHRGLGGDTSCRRDSSVSGQRWRGNAFAANVRTDDTTSQSATSAEHRRLHRHKHRWVANLSDSGIHSLAVQRIPTRARCASCRHDLAQGNFPSGRDYCHLHRPPQYDACCRHPLRHCSGTGRCRPEYSDHPIRRRQRGYQRLEHRQRSSLLQRFCHGLEIQWNPPCGENRHQGHHRRRRHQHRADGGEHHNGPDGDGGHGVQL